MATRARSVPACLDTPELHWGQMLRHGLIALIMDSLLLRYFYCQKTMQRQQKRAQGTAASLQYASAALSVQLA